ncbi:MAG: hypothetical protein ACOC5T_08015 [Elusimicrobiota bacterium]
MSIGTNPLSLVRVQGNNNNNKQYFNSKTLNDKKNQKAIKRGNKPHKSNNCENNQRLRNAKQKTAKTRKQGLSKLKQEITETFKYDTTKTARLIRKLQKYNIKAITRKYAKEFLGDYSNSQKNRKLLKIKDKIKYDKKKKLFIFDYKKPKKSKKKTKKQGIQKKPIWEIYQKKLVFRNPKYVKKTKGDYTHRKPRVHENYLLLQQGKKPKQEKTIIYKKRNGETEEHTLRLNEKIHLIKQWKQKNDELMENKQELQERLSRRMKRQKNKYTDYNKKLQQEINDLHNATVNINKRLYKLIQQYQKVRNRKYHEEKRAIQEAKK